MPAPAAPPGPDFSSLERHLFKITSQIEALQRPDGIEQSISAFRSELAEIRIAITEAMPRRAIESIENEIRSLSRRIDDNRQSGTDGQALAGIERALSEIREVLRSLTPAEQLAGYDEAIRNLGGKLDLILRSNDDPSTVRQLEGAIAALRSIVSNVASNDALARLSDDVHTLSSKVDQLSRAGDSSDSFAILEQRIAALTSTLESRARPAADRKHRTTGKRAAGAVRPARPHAGRQRQRLRLRPSRTARVVSAGTARILQRSRAAAISGGSRTDCRIFCAISKPSMRTSPRWPRTAATRAPPQDSGIADIVKRELSDIRFSQTERDRHTQDSLEAVHNTLGHVVDRLAMIEGDLRSVRSAPAAPEAPPAPPAPRRKPPHPRPMAPRGAMPPQPKPELPNPAASEAHFAAAPREFHAARAQCRPRSPRWRRERSARFWSRMPRHRAPRSRPSCRPIIRWSRARGRPDGRRRRRSASRLPKTPSAKSPPARRSRAPHRASSPPPAAPPRPPPPHLPTPKPAGKAARGPAKAPKAAGAGDKEPSTITSKIRSLLVGASVVVIVLGTFKMAMTLLDSGGSAPQPPAVENSSEPPRSGSAARRFRRQTGGAGARDAFDDRADADRPAIVQCFRTR